jgi:hypothetical protein
MAVPNVTWYVDEAGACKVFMHHGDAIRSFWSASVAVAERTIASVAIDAFGMSQPDAEVFAQSAVAEQMKAAALPQTLSDHMELLQEQLSESQDSEKNLTSELIDAKATIATNQETIDDQKTTISDLTSKNQQLEEQIAKLTAPKPVTAVPDAPAVTSAQPAPIAAAAPSLASDVGAQPATDSLGHSLPGGHVASSAT